MAKSPNPIDKHVGSRLRLRRVHIGMSQEKLGDALGITFQQIQKYEKGANRIGASRLQQAARILGVPVNFFFDGAELQSQMASGFADDGSAGLSFDALTSADAQQLLAAFQRITDPKVRKRIVDLIEAMAADNAN